MQKSKFPLVKWNIICIFIACLDIFLDQISKNWIRSHLLVGQSMPETGFFRLTRAENTGAAFSIFYGQADVLAVVSMLGTLLILLYTFYFSRHLPFLDTRLNKVALGLMLGGTVGNMIDRITVGHVTDFVDVGPWPIFNVADSSLVVGIIIFALGLLIATRKEDITSKN
jgi:signal peptidase II